MADATLTKIDAWLKAKNLNEFGDTEHTVYMGGNPLFNEMTGERMTRLEYLLKKFPGKPWDDSLTEEM